VLLKAEENLFTSSYPIRNHAEFEVACKRRKNRARERVREKRIERVILDTFYGILDFRSCLIISLLYPFYDILFIYFNYLYLYIILLYLLYVLLYDTI
jgi:hypothetical protein